MPNRWHIRQMRYLSAAAILFAIPVWAFGEDEAPEKKKVPTADSVSWMAGHWRGTMFGSLLEETWNEPRGGSMLGMSRIGDGGRGTMFEALLIEQVGDDVFMFLRHFKSQLSSNEKDPMKFKLASVKDRRAIFEAEDDKLQFVRIIYERKDDDTMIVRLEGKGDKARAAESEMKRVRDK